MTLPASALTRFKTRIMARIRSVARRGVVENSNSAGKLQTLQVATLADDVSDDVEHFEPHGFTSRPPTGSEGLIVHIGADTAHPVALNFSDRTIRLIGLAEGEVALYHDSGATLVLKNDGDIDVFPAASRKVNLGGPGGPAIARLGDETTTPSLAVLQTVLSTWVPPPGPTIDNGAALKAALASAGFLTDPNVDKGTITSAGDGSTST